MNGLQMIIFSALMTTLVMLYGREQYKRGVEDVKFDRVAANIKIQQCNEVITKYALEH